MHYLIHTGPGIGDIIQFLSMARAIKEQVPDSTVDLLMRGSDMIWKLNQQILECQDYVDELYWYSSKELLHDAKLIGKLRKKHYDFGVVRIGNVNGDSSLWIYRIMRLAGCRKVIGTGTDKVDVKVKVPKRIHYLERNAMLLEAIGIKGRDNALSINKEKLDNQWLANLNIPDDAIIIGLSLGTNSMLWRENNEVITYDVKSWPYLKWFQLAEKLVKGGFTVVLIGGPKERKEVAQVGLEFPVSNKIIDLVGKTSIKQSFTILNRCALMVGAEGGMMHCASALGIKTLTIFGGSDYKIWNPGGKDSPIINQYLDCAPCFCTSAGAHCSNHKCLNDITPEEVFERVSMILTEDKGAVGCSI